MCLIIKVVQRAASSPDVVSKEMSEHIVLKMKKILKLRTKKKHVKNNGREPLIENNNNHDREDGGHVRESLVYENPLAQNTINAEKEQHLQGDENTKPQDLAQLLGMSSDAFTSEDRSCCSVCPDLNPGQQNIKQYILLIHGFWSQRIPKPPADLDQSLKQHVENVQKAVFDELQRLAPLLKSWGLMGCLIKSCHCQTFDHLQSLLPNISSCRNHFMLMKWVRHTYLSKEVLSDPDEKMLSKWETNVKDKLLKNVQKEVKGSLSNILQNEKRQQHCKSDEDYVGLYVDIIQCIGAMSSSAQIISQDLCDEVQEVCFQELLTFVKEYSAQQKEVLNKRAEMDKLETIHFLKVLRTCKELRSHTQTKGKDVEPALFKDTMATLEHLEAFTVKLLADTVAGILEPNLKKYFKSHSKSFLPFIAIEELFPRLGYVLDEHKAVMDEIYKIVSHTYFKHLIQIKMCKLKKQWSAEVGQTVSEDATMLHDIISNLAPGVQEWNKLLLNIPEVLDCNTMDGLKLTLGSIQTECNRQSEDLKLLPDLLRWKGHSKREVREVMEALPDSEPRLRSGSWFCCLTCCVDFSDRIESRQTSIRC